MWSEFESEVIEGRYPLEKLVRTEGRCAWYASRFEEKPAVVSLIESLNDESALLERLQKARKVSHPNVVQIFASGTTTVHDTPMVYAVMEFTEENLEDVLRTRALSAEETQQVAESLIPALGALHKERLVAGRLEAANVLAVGETIKLRSDHLQVVPAQENLNAQTAKDVRGLGALLMQCLTQRYPGNNIGSNDPSLQLLPAPFVQVVRRALAGAPLDELAAILNPQSAAKVTTAAPAQATPPDTKSATPPAVAKATAPKVPATEPQKTEQKKTAPPPQAPVAVKTSSLVEDAEPANNKTPLILGGFLVLLLLAGLGLWMLLRPKDPAPANQPAPARKVVVAPSSPSAPPTPSAAAAPPQAQPPAPSSGGNDVWRVVAYTYNHQDQAAHKAQTVNEKHSELHAEVFSAKGGAPYLVTLGGGMDHAAAARFRSRAIHEGMPRDTYIQNYSH